MQKGFILILILSLILISFSIAEEENFDVGKSDESNEQITQTEEVPVTEDGPIQNFEIQVDQETGQQTIDLQETETEYYFDGTTNPEYNWDTAQGTISSFSITNALVSFGNFIQGSFVSFENNNNLFFGSLFDSSEFTATLNEDGTINVGQRNGNGDLGRVYITINNGNLTQDEYVVFIPEGNEPTYIYYNTTEIEFKDGNLTLLGETITNNDDSKEKTKVNFDSEGFTKIQLPSENMYTINDYSIQNKENQPIIICKKNPLCDVNIDEGRFTIKGEVIFLEKEEVLIESYDENNEITIDTSEKTLEFYNGNPSEEVLLITNVKNHRLIETSSNIYEYPTENGIKYFSYESKWNNKVIDLKENLVYNNFTAFENKFENYIPVITGAFYGGFENDLGISLVLFVVLIGLLVFVQYKRKGQMSILVIFGLALLLVVGLIFYWSINGENDFQTLTEIESLEQAQEAVEECEESLIEESVALLGMHTGYIEESFSSFGTAYELIPKETMEENLELYLEQELRECGNILEDTKFSFEATRFTVDVSLEEEIIVSVDSIGKIKNENMINVNEIEEEYSIDYNEILLIVEELISSEHGIPVNSYEGYVVESFTNEDFSERLIVVRDRTGFEFRISQKI